MIAACVTISTGVAVLKYGALLLALLAGGVGLLLAVEVRRWLTGPRLVSHRRFLIRLAAGAILLALLIAIASGLYWFDLHQYHGKPALFLGFWSVCLLAGLALLALAVADLREVGRSLTRSQHQVWRDFARFIAAEVQKKPDPGAPGNDGRSC